MSDQFLLPDLGEGLTEAEVVSWLVAEGDVIAVDQLVVEVESAKSVVELPSPYAGRVAALHAAVGQSVSRGAPLITIVADRPDHARSTDPIGTVPAPPSDVPTPSDPAAVAERTSSSEELVPGTALRDEGGDASGAVLVGYGTKEPPIRSVRQHTGRFGGRGSTPEPGRTNALPQSPTPPLGGSSGVTGREHLLDRGRRSPVVSPIVRRLAREHGFDAGDLAGSGRDSMVLRRDVEAAIATLELEEAVRHRPEEHSAAVPAPARGGRPDGETRIPITGTRKLIASRLSHSRRVIPEATIWLDVDATELLRAKDRLEQSTGERFGVTALVARFAVAALTTYPILNSSVDDERDEIVQHGPVHLGIAAQTSRGLMVPVVRDADRMTTRQLRDAVGSLVERAGAAEYAPGELSGSTFTVNNYGGFGVDGSAPIINHPEVAMLGIGRVMDRPWVVDGALAVRKVVVLSFVFDHRVCDGDVAAGFLTTVAKLIEEPLLLVADT